jgi:hypothetical protein
LEEYHFVNANIFLELDCKLKKIDTSVFSSPRIKAIPIPKRMAYVFLKDRMFTNYLKKQTDSERGKESSQRHSLYHFFYSD